MSRQLPGYETGRTVTPREPLLSHDGMIQVPIVLDAVNGVDGSNGTFTYEIRAGWLMGRIAASGLWTPCKRTTVNGTTGTVTAVVLANAAAFVVGDTITIGTDTGISITAIDYATNTITIASTTVADGDVVFSEDGSQTCRGMLLDFARLRKADNTAPANQSARLLIQGAVKISLLLGDATAIRADTAAKLSGIRFSDDHGQ